MSNWKTVFRSRKARERNEVSFACTSCGSRYGYALTESGTPPDGACTCAACTSKAPSSDFKTGFSEIDWSKFESNLDWEGKKGGRTVGRMKR